MNLIEIVADVLGLIGSPQADHDRSIVGESPMERGIRRFWKTVVIVLVVAVVAIALYARHGNERSRTSPAPAAAMGGSTSNSLIPGNATPAT